MQTTLTSKISKTIFMLFLFFALSNSSFAQGSKPHFLVNNTGDAKETASYYDLLSNFNLDEYRFYDKRRTIKFVNSNVTVELYSAKELLEIYQKPISPFTIMDNIAKKDISFYLNGGKIQIVTLK
ncbi:hypothetical protein BH10BAC1_BH10BAC1_03360 [soil metagenome]